MLLSHSINKLDVHNQKDVWKILKYLEIKQKEPFPLKRGALPISTVCGKVKLEQVAFPISYVFEFWFLLQAEQMSQLKTVFLTIHSMFWGDSLVHLEMRG